MTKQTNGATNASETQLHMFLDLAQGICTDHSLQRFEIALRTILQPLKKAPSSENATVPSPTHSREP